MVTTWMTPLLLLLGLQALLRHCHAASYNVAQFFVTSPQCFPLWTKDDIPGGKDASITVAVKNPGQGKLGVLIYAYTDSRFLGLYKDETFTLLCSQEAIDQKLCADQVGFFIYSGLDDQASAGSNPYAFIQSDVLDFEARPNEAVLKTVYENHRHGLFCVRMAYGRNATQSSLQNDADFEKQFSPTITVMNPYGSLPADQYIYLQYYGAAAVAYLLLCLAWFYRAYRYRRFGNIHSRLISLLLLVTNVDYALLYGYYQNWNTVGYNSILFLVICEILSSIKISLCFITVYFVSRDLESGAVLKVKEWKYLVILTVILGVAFFAFRLISLLSSSSTWVAIACTPVAAVVGWYYHIIFKHLNSCIHELTQHQQFEILKKYRMLRVILVFTAMTMAAFVLVEVSLYAKMKDYDWLNMNWTSVWLLRGAWFDVLYLFCVLSVAYLWRPMAKIRRQGLRQLQEERLDDLPLESLRASWTIEN